MGLVLVVFGTIAVAGLVAAWIRRRQRDLADVDDTEYRDPPYFHGQAGPH